MNKLQPGVAVNSKDTQYLNKRRKKIEQMSSLQSLLEPHVKLRGIPFNSIHKIFDPIFPFLWNKVGFFVENLQNSIIKLFKYHRAQCWIDKINFEFWISFFFFFLLCVTNVEQWLIDFAIVAIVSCLAYIYMHVSMCACVWVKCGYKEKKT